jgi:hypothetical protein
MTWKECSVMDERLRLVARLLEGEAMTESVTILRKNRPRGFPDFALSSTVPAALKARHRKPSHFGSYCHGPSKSGSVSAVRASIGERSSGKPKLGCPADTGWTKPLSLRDGAFVMRRAANRDA